MRDQAADGMRYGKHQEWDGRGTGKFKVAGGYREVSLMGSAQFVSGDIITLQYLQDQWNDRVLNSRRVNEE